MLREHNVFQDDKKLYENKSIQKNNLNLNRLNFVNRNNGNVEHFATNIVIRSDQGSNQTRLKRVPEPMEHDPSNFLLTASQDLPPST
ncbi:unnamed protein product [Ceratitis capitata]|uniref:(Mediterranean fruit fly) hypothetical protein n=1 Tax=Ceratitis capitata TaxID=7213 RepID=A0A811URB2_CERCA|nr:unnamed protein product [Ceratitis capitata]